MADEDLKRISAQTRTRIARAVDSRLSTAPERFGVPLAGTLRAYRKLRVGDYRVVFRVTGRDVWVLAIVHRREVYERAARRLG